MAIWPYVLSAALVVVVLNLLLLSVFAFLGLVSGETQRADVDG